VWRWQRDGGGTWRAGATTIRRNKYHWTNIHASVISSLCRQVAKTLTPNKDSDKKCFGRCVEKNGIIL